MHETILNTDIITKDTDGSGDSAQEDCKHWGGFRVGDEIAPLEGDAASIIRAVAPVANSVINNPQMPKPQAPQLANTLQMAPQAPGMSSMGGGAPRLPTPANNPAVQTVKTQAKSDTE